MFVIVFLHLLFLWNQDFAECVRILDLQVSTHAAEGGEAFLGCQFDLEGDVLYSVKWFKDGREFFRYVPITPIPIKSFPTPGIIVDLTRSSSNIVTLVQLDRESAGLYRCAVTGEAPSFNYVSMEKYISVYLLPEDGPNVTGLQNRYGIGDEVILNCTSGPSRPAAELKWFLNGDPAPVEYVYGPWYKISTDYIEAVQKKQKRFKEMLDSSNHTDADFQSTLKLMFRVRPEHFVDGVLTIKCQATIAPLYQQETNFTYYLEIPETNTGSETGIDENIFPFGASIMDSDEADEATASRTSLFLTVIIYFSLLMIN